MASLDEIYERMNDDLEYKLPDIDSEIQKFYTDKTLLVTGATGFMGKCLVEKLLRSCSGIKHMYIMLREGTKDKLPVDQRLEKYFQHQIFTVLRKEYPNFEEKVTAIRGNLFEANLGLSDEDRSIIVKETNIIFHNAANVKFDIKVNLSLRTNVLGTKQMLDLAQDCENLEIFMYVSTAYSHCYKKRIDEEFYPPPGDMKLVNDMIKADYETKDGLSGPALKMLIGDHPNIYTFTKAMSEDLVYQCSKTSRFAVGVYRPAIVVSSAKEPLVGWCGNWNGPVVIMLGCGLGAFHTSYHLCYPMDYIPVDYTINALIAITWDLNDRWKAEHKAVVYNYGSSTTNPVTLKDLYNWVKGERDSERSRNAVSKNFIIFASQEWFFWILHWTLHFIPACLGDLALLVTGRKAVLLSIFWKATKNMDKVDYFGNGNWRIHVPETLKVIDKMNAVDKEIFYCDIRKHDWQHFMLVTWRGLKLYLLKEPFDPVNALKRYRILLTVHYTLTALLLLALYYFVMKLYNAVF